MTNRTSRRAFLLGIGGSVASVSLALGLWKYRPWLHIGGSYPVSADSQFVDYSGWILTPADKAELTATAGIRLIEGAVFSGDTIAERKTESVDACASWCVQEPECRGFTYAKADHPDLRLRNMCSLKGASRLAPTADASFISGVR